MKKLVLFALPLMALVFAVSCKKQEPAPVPEQTTSTEAAPATTENAAPATEAAPATTEANTAATPAQDKK